MKENILVLPVGTQVMCIQDCYEDSDDGEQGSCLYIKGVVYTVNQQGMIKDEEGCTRQWKQDWFTISPEFYKYFEIINL